MPRQDTTVAEKTQSHTVTDPKTDAAALEKLITARIGLLLRAPFFGNLATRLRLTNADEWCGTAATDGRNFWYNSEFINRLSLRECEFLFGHEVLHVVYDHIGRRQDRDPMLSNIAADYCVNQDLLDHKIGERITKVPILHNAKYRGMSFEEVYDDLFANARKIKVSDLLKQVLDEHLETNNDDNEDHDRSGKPKLGPQDIRDIRDEIKDAVLQAAQAAGTDNLPLGISRLIRDITNPVINWREMLLQQIQSLVKFDYSWQKPSRRSWHCDAVLPGQRPGHQIDVCVAIDASGSISNVDLQDYKASWMHLMSIKSESGVLTPESTMFKSSPAMMINRSLIMNPKAVAAQISCPIGHT